MSFPTPDAGQGDYWLNSWKDGKIPWHRTGVNPYLKQCHDQLLGGRPAMPILVPMCGKSEDLKWLADQGHTVVGVELSRQAVVEFFEENKFEYTEKKFETTDDSVFQTTDGKIRLYCCSIFDMRRDMEGAFDAIWDWGALIAFPEPERRRYSKVMRSLMSDDCRYVVGICQTDPAEWSAFAPSGGSPYMVSQEEIVSLYGEQCRIDQLSTQQDPKYSQEFNMKQFAITLILFTQKL